MFDLPGNARSALPLGVSSYLMSVSDRSGGEEGLAAYARALLSRVPELAERAASETLAIEPSYRDNVPSSELRDAAGASIALMLETLAGLRPHLDYADLGRQLGEARVQQGVPLDVLTRAAHRDFHILWEAIQAEAKQREGERAMPILLRAVVPLWAVVDTYSTAVAEGYRTAQDEIIRRDSERKQALLRAIFDGRGAEPGILREATYALDLPSEGAFVAVTAIASTAYTDDRGPSSAERLVPAVALRRRGMRSAWLVQPDGSTGLVALSERGLPGLVTAEGLWQGLRVGVSPVFHDLGGAALALRCSTAAAESIPATEQAVHLLEEHLPGALLGSNKDFAERLVQRVLGPLMACKSSERDRLLETLTLFVECEGSVTKVAARAFCHRNTVLQRLRRIEELTLLSPSTPRGAGQFVLALEALKLTSSSA